MDDIHPMLTEAGYKLGGSMWGAAAWKVVNPHLILSIAQGMEGLDTPTDSEAATQLWIYRADPEVEDFKDFKIDPWGTDGPDVENILKLKFKRLKPALAYAEAVAKNNS